MTIKNFFFNASNEEATKIINLIAKILNKFNEMALGIQANHLIKKILTVEESEVKTESESIKLIAFSILDEMANVITLTGCCTYNRWMLISWLCRKTTQIGIERYFFITQTSEYEKQYLANYEISSSLSRETKISLIRIISDLRYEIDTEKELLLPEEELELYNSLKSIIYDLEL